MLEHWVSSTAAFLKTKNTKARDNKMFCSANDSFSFLKLIIFNVMLFQILKTALQK